MPGPKAIRLSLLASEEEALKQLIRAHKTSQQIVFRSRILLLLHEDLPVLRVAKRLKTTPKTVRLWRQHFLERGQYPLLERLQDDPRPGGPQTFTAEQFCQILALACESPTRSERPISHWTPRELADESIKRGIVKTISTRHVGRFLKSGRFKTSPRSTVASLGN